MKINAQTDGEVQAVVLFDGVCNLCNHSVQWLIAHDTKHVLRFGSLQSDHGQHLRRAYGIADGVDSIIVLHGGHALTYSDAVLALGDTLGGGYRVVSNMARIVPRPVRDIAYRFVAAHRYQWFGRKDVCTVPTPATKALFLADQ